MDAFVLCLVAPATSSSSSNSSNSSSSSSSSSDVCAPLGLLEEFSSFIEELEKQNVAMDSLAPICLDSSSMPADAGSYSPLRDAVDRHGHCFALFKGKTLQ
ncbi:hypothetical protein ETH_00035765, partial [Eimeria tenella]